MIVRDAVHVGTFVGHDNYFCTVSNPISSVDIKVGSFLRQWVVSVTGSDQVRLDRRTNLWGIVKQNLELLPNDYQPITDRSEYISIALLEIRQRPTYNIPSGRMIWLNELYRCHISDSGQEAITRYLYNQFRNAFRVYMVARFSDESGEAIRHAIGSFLSDFNLPIDNTMIGRLSKDWYRYRQKNTENYEIPIFF